MHIAIIDYGSGNLNSVSKAFSTAINMLGDHLDVMITQQGDDLLNASHIVLPGVGAFDDCARNLKQTGNLWEKLNHAVLNQGKPFLGMCVGEQLMVQYGSEGEGAEGLGWIEGTVEKIVPEQKDLKVPHMGWNDIHCPHDHPVFSGLNGKDMYFTHSWSVRNVPDKHCLAYCDYGQKIVAAIGKDNMVGVQFHPEKSQKFGLELIRNFLQWSI